MRLQNTRIGRAGRGRAQLLVCALDVGHPPFKDAEEFRKFLFRRVAAKRAPSLVMERVVDAPDGNAEGKVLRALRMDAQAPLDLPDLSGALYSFVYF
jgi:hypothetical protein